VSRGGLLTRDTEGRWRFLRTFPGDGGAGRIVTVLPGGDVVVAGQWMRVWSRLPGTDAVAALHQPVMGGPQIGAVHVLPDGRLVAGFGNPDRPGVGGWLQVWAAPVGENRSERVNLPMAIDVTGLADDGTYLQVVGRGGSVDIALDALPFATGHVPR